MKIKKMNEADVRKNIHQAHFEDLVLFGEQGIVELNNKIEGFFSRLQGKDSGINTTVKIDGAPAVICWSHIEGYPDNSICLKSFVNGAQNALSSDEDIEAKYGDRPEMTAKLMFCLDLAKCIPSGEAWQGDCLFTANDKKEVEIDDKQYITFHPNKIVYAFSEDNPGYEKVRDANFGIAFHTIYKKSGEGLKQSFRVDASRLNNVPEDIYVMSPALNASTKGEDYNYSELLKQYSELQSLEQKLLDSPEYEELINNDAFMKYWNTFENANLADKKQTNIDVNTFYEDLVKYIKDKQTAEFEKKMSTLKTERGKQNAQANYDKSVQELADLLSNNQNVLINLVKTLNKAADIKMNLWNGFKKSKQDYDTYYKSKTKGYIPADMEGIAMSDDEGNIVKIVDRSTFSNANRDPDIMSGFEHESLEEDIGDYYKVSIDGKGLFIEGDKIYKELYNEDNMDCDDVNRCLYELEKDLKYSGRNDLQYAYTEEGLNKYKDVLNELKNVLKRNGHTLEIKKVSPKNIEYNDDNQVGFKESLDEGKDLECDLEYLDELNSKLKDIEIVYARGYGDYYSHDTRIKFKYKGKLYSFVDRLTTSERIGGDDGGIAISTEYDISNALHYHDLDDGYIAQEDLEEYIELLKLSAEYLNKSGEKTIYVVEPYNFSKGAKTSAMKNSFNYIIKDLKKKLVNESLEESFNTLLEDAGKTAVVAFGRLNPPTIGHKKLVDKLKEVANKVHGEPMLFLSHTCKPDKNPLTYERKLEWCKKAFGDVVKDSNAINIFKVLPVLYNEGYDNVIIVTGDDRIDAYNKYILENNGKPVKNPDDFYKFISVEVISAGARNDDADDASGASASKARQFAKDGDFESFSKIVPFERNEAHSLYSEVRKGLNESLNESTSKVNKDPDYQQLKSMLINELPNELTANASDIRHADKGELVRVNASKENPSLKIVQLISDILKNVNDSEGFIEIGDFGKHNEVSGTYSSLLIKYHNKNYYVVIGDRSKKTYTPGEVFKKVSINKIDYVKISDYINNINGLSLKEMYDEAVEHSTPHNTSAFNTFINDIVSGDIDGSLLEFSASINPRLTQDIDDTSIYGILNDFGEVLSAGCLGSIIAHSAASGGCTKITFPDAANEPLCDYMIESNNKVIKVSQKAGEGAAPSCSSAIEIILDSYNDHNYKKTIDTETTNGFIDFIKWMDKNVTRNKGASKVSIHDGYVNMANAVFNKPIWFECAYGISSIMKYKNQGSVNKDNIYQFVDDIKKLTGASLSFNNTKIDNKQYCESIRVRYIARLFWGSINKSTLIDDLNKALDLALGQFIQVYLKSSPEEFREGYLHFKVKTISDKNNFILRDGSAIDNKTNKIGMKKLSMVLR